MNTCKEHRKAVRWPFVRVSQRDSHVNVRRLEAALVDVVEGEGLRGVGAVLVHLHRRAAPPLAVGLGLGLLPPGRHDLRQSESHDAWGCGGWLRRGWGGGAVAG